MTPEQQAAVERLRMYAECAGGHGNPYYRERVPPQSIQDDLFAVIELIDLLLAEHRPDDSLPVSEEWLRSVGFCEYKDDDGVAIETLAGMYLNWIAGLGFWLDESWWEGSTRGDVRTLCRALGIPLTEEAAT